MDLINGADQDKAAVAGASSSRLFQEPEGRGRRRCGRRRPLRSGHAADAARPLHPEIESARPAPLRAAKQAVPIIRH